MSNNVKFKIVILGTQGVGKTCLINRFVNDKFSDKYQSVSRLLEHCISTSRNVIIKC